MTKDPLARGKTGWIHRIGGVLAALVMVASFAIGVPVVEYLVNRAPTESARYLAALHQDPAPWPANDSDLLAAGYKLCDAVRQAKSNPPSESLLSQLARADTTTMDTDHRHLTVTLNAATIYLCPDAQL